LLAVAIAFALRRAGIAYFAGATTVLLGMLVFVYTDAEMKEMTVREGCATGYPIDSVFFVCLGMAAIVSGFRAKRRMT
jgi:hypothetical protein